MKTRTLLTTLILSGFILLQAPVQAAPLTKKAKRNTWQKEIAHYLYNIVLPNKLDDGLVIIHFNVDQAHTIQNLKIYSDNELLQKAFKERLLGKSLNSLNQESATVEPTTDGYVLKVHLKVK